jgi:hypothetical protein
MSARNRAAQPSRVSAKRETERETRDNMAVTGRRSPFKQEAWGENDASFVPVRTARTKKLAQPSTDMGAGKSDPAQP